MAGIFKHFHLPQKAGFQFRGEVRPLHIRYICWKKQNIDLWSSKTYERVPVNYSISFWIGQWTLLWFVVNALKKDLTQKIFKVNIRKCKRNGIANEILCQLSVIMRPILWRHQSLWIRSLSRIENRLRQWYWGGIRSREYVWRTKEI